MTNSHTSVNLGKYLGYYITLRVLVVVYFKIVKSRELGCTICEFIIREVDSFLTRHVAEEEITNFVQGVSNCL